MYNPNLLCAWKVSYSYVKMSTLKPIFFFLWKKRSWGWCHTLRIPALELLKQRDCLKFKANVVSRAKGTEKGVTTGRGLWPQEWLRGKLCFKSRWVENWEHNPEGVGSGHQRSSRNVSVGSDFAICASKTHAKFTRLAHCAWAWARSPTFSSLISSPIHRLSPLWMKERTRKRRSGMES